MNTEVIDPKARLKGRITLLALLFVFSTPLLFALLWRPEGRVNYGELIQPPQLLVTAALTLDGGSAESTEIIREKWRWATLADGSCDAQCEETLYTLRQSRLVLGKNAKRVQYAVVMLSPDMNDSTSLPAAGPDTEHPLLERYVATGEDAEALRQQFGSLGNLNSVFLIDPLGNIIMRYPADVDGKMLKKDLYRLLKGSHVG